MTLGILALQGDVREHAAAFADLGVDAREVRRPRDLRRLDGIVLPGGESTTLSLLLTSSGLLDPLAGALGDGLPVFGTCAGLVLLAREVLDGRPDQRSFGLLDCTVRRNGYGRQRFSFESTLDATALDRVLGGGGPGSGGGDGPGSGGGEGPGGTGGGSGDGGAVSGGGGGDGRLPAVFIRAPRVVAVGPEVEVLAVLGAGDGEEGAGEDGSDPVICRHGSVLATAFHPELTQDRRLHRLFAGMAHVLPGSAGMAHVLPGAGRQDR